MCPASGIASVSATDDTGETFVTDCMDASGVQRESRCTLMRR